jgi:hypothetical protein
VVAVFATTAHTCCVRWAQLGKEEFQEFGTPNKMDVVGFFGVFFHFSFLFGKKYLKIYGS